MAKKKPLHIDHESREVIPVGERETYDGKTTYQHVIYNNDDYKAIEFSYLTGVEAASLILGGVRIEKCYVSELRVGHFIDAKRLLKDKQSSQKLLAWFEDHLPFFSSKVKKRFDENINDLDSVFTHPEIGHDTTFLSMKRIKKHLEGEQTKFKGDIKLTESIIGQIQLDYLVIDGWVYLNRYKDYNNPNVDPDNAPVFKPTIIFNLTTRGLHVQGQFGLENCVITGPKGSSARMCDLSGIITGNLGLQRIETYVPVRFGGLELNNRIRLEINENLWVDNCKFHSAVDFSGIKITKKAFFDNSKFLAIQSNCPADKTVSATFENSYFGGDASFKSVEFAGDAHFEDATFNGRVDFSDTKPDSEDISNEAHFHGKASFKGSNFKGNANFSGVVFDDYVDFRGVHFEEHGWFRNTAFANEANFRSADFHRNAIFYGKAKKPKIPYANFSRARVRGAADFRDREFGTLDLSQSTFEEPLQFHDSTFESVDFREITAHEIRVSFEELQPDKKHGPRLKSHRWLLHVDEPEEIQSQKDDPLNPYPKWDKERNWRETKRQYLTLKQNFRKQEQYEYEDEAHWWASECSMRALPKWNPWHLIMWLFVRNMLGYGVKPKQVLTSIAAVILISWVLFSVGYDNLSFKDDIPPTENCCINSLYFSVITYATVGFGDVSPRGWLVFVAMAEGLLGVTLSGALIIIIFRKLIR